MLALFPQMSKSEFQLAYDGPSLRDGTMEVGELASSLLAVGDLLRNANRELNGNRAEVSLHVKADFKSGSFDVALLLDQGLLEQANNILIPGAVVGGTALLHLVFGTDAGKKGLSGILTSVLDIWKKLRGEKPKSVVEDRGKGVTILVCGDGNEVTVDAYAGALYTKDSIRSSLTGVVRPLTKDGIRTLNIRKGKTAINVVTQADLPLALHQTLALSETSSANALRDSREALLRVVRANFEKGKWGFSDGAANFSADITDNGFKQKLDSREIGFYKGDTLRVILTTTQVVMSEDQTFHTKYEIEKVIEHIHAPKQQKLIE